MRRGPKAEAETGLNKCGGVGASAALRRGGSPAPEAGDPVPSRREGGSACGGSPLAPALGMRPSWGYGTTGVVRTRVWSVPVIHRLHVCRFTCSPKRTGNPQTSAQGAFVHSLLWTRAGQRDIVVAPRAPPAEIGPGRPSSPLSYAHKSSSRSAWCRFGLFLVLLLF